MKKPDATKITTSVTTEGNSSWFSGHFPNNPILPGIAQLKMVVDLIAKPREGNLCITGLSRVKFRKIVRPGERLDIQVTCNNTENHYMFRITSGDEDVCSGKMDFTQNEKLRIHE
jgi:3-hydroxymyristoyl/3-hydroxydecanoyl-(acyl carrier protein) dehydratase